MLKVEMDAVVKEYAMRIMSSVVSGPNRLVELPDQVGDRLKERLLMSVLGNAVVSGAASHSYDAQRHIDQFVSTDRLVRNWSWLFPGAKLTADRLQKYPLEIEGSRSRYIREGWLAADRNNPSPPWPN
jgi:hypothetical protein